MLLYQAYMYVYVFMDTKFSTGPVQFLLKKCHCRFFNTELLFRINPLSFYCISLSSSGRFLIPIIILLKQFLTSNNLKTYPFSSVEPFSQRSLKVQNDTSLGEEE